MSALKKIISTVLLIATLVLALASCNGGDEGIKNNGLLDESVFDKAGVHLWKGDGREVQFDAEVGTMPWEQVKEKLTSGGRLGWFNFYFKYAVVNKTITKVKFTIEADRNVTVCFAGSHIGVNDALMTALKTVSLNAGEKTEVVLEPDYFVDIKYANFQITLFPDNTRNYYKLSEAERVEWAKTVYKITNIELYAE